MPSVVKNIIGILCFILLLSPVRLSAHANNNNTSARFIQNKNQWPSPVLFGVKLSYGMIFIENDGLTFNVNDPNIIHQQHEYSHHSAPDPGNNLPSHSFKIHFDGSQTPTAEGKSPFKDYVNYFIGKDSSKWAGNVPVFGEVYLNNLYPGIDLHIYESNGHFKYDYIVNPGADASLIRFHYEGIRSKIENENIVLSSAIGDFIENAPVTYQITAQGKKAIASHYQFNDKGYSIQTAAFDASLPLIIDPEMVFASFSGSLADNRGFTATYDNSGFLYVGGVAFGIGYPTTTGAYQNNFNDGGNDIVVSKYSADGSKFLFSTYIGGTFGTEEPHSMVVDKNNQLMIMGSTGSYDFPTTLSAYDNTFNGGTSTTIFSFSYYSGTDIFITKLNAAGSALIGSTYIGGSDNDGLNDEAFSSDLSYNYGDYFRGEIITDNAGNAYVASTTKSTNFPISSGFQTSFGGGNHDGVIMKLNKNLSALVWSSYLGGSDDDAAYSMQFDSNSDLYIAGGTNSTNFPTTAGVLHKNSLGGIDGYLAHISSNGKTLKSSTYLGTSSYDQCYFVQLDHHNNVFVYGQSAGNYPVTPANVYSNANSGQFIHKMNSTLTSTIFSSVFGGGDKIQLSPTAFLVSNCEDIYISGWGGASNSSYRDNVYPSSSALVGKTYNLPITPDAYQHNTDGSDFYVAVFSKDMQNLKYATYLGGPATAEHVDGGTSRFDKKGNIYQAICGGCGGLSDFPTTPGVVSTIDQSNVGAQCNEVGVKLAASKLSAAISGSVDSTACLNEPVTFKNQSNGGISYLWKFGTGDSSTAFEPVYKFKNLGDYKITLLATNPEGCPPIDTAFMTLHIHPPLQIVMVDDTICPGSSVTLTASGATSYTWKPAATLNKSSGPQVIATPKANTKYVVNTNGSYCIVDTASVNISLHSLAHQISPNDSACAGDAHPLFAKTGSSFQWTPAQYFSNAASGQTTVSLQQSKTLYVSFKTPAGCQVKDSVYVKIIPPPVFNIHQDSLICYGKSLVLDPGMNGNYSYSWTPVSGLDNSKIKKPKAQPNSSTLYTVAVTNMCGKDISTYQVNVSKVRTEICPDSTICPGDSLALWANGGMQYLWSPANTLSSTSVYNPLAFPSADTEYKVVISNADHCSDSAYTKVHIATIPYTSIDSVYVIEYGNDLQINSSYKNYMLWSPATDLSCTECASPLVKLPENDITYQFELFDRRGCYFKDSVNVYVIRKVYVPNAFTPNGDGKNDIFYFSSVSVNEDFELMIFNRWGELIFTSYDIDEGWNGQYNGKNAQIDTYVWKVRYRRDHTLTWKEEIGKVSLVR